MPTQNPWAWVWAPNAGLSHMRLRARGPYISSTLIGGKGGPVQVRSPLRLGDQWSM